MNQNLLSQINGTGFVSVAAFITIIVVVMLSRSQTAAATNAPALSLSFGDKLQLAGLTVAVFALMWAVVTNPLSNSAGATARAPDVASPSSGNARGSGRSSNNHTAKTVRPTKLMNECSAPKPDTEKLLNDEPVAPQTGEISPTPIGPADSIAQPSDSLGEPATADRRWPSDVIDRSNKAKGDARIWRHRAAGHD